MTISTETFNRLWKNNLEAAQQYIQLALESTVQVIGTQARYFADITQMSRDKHLQIWSDHPSKTLEHWLQLVENHLDVAAEATHSHLDTTSQLQCAFSRIVKDQIS